MATKDESRLRTKSEVEDRLDLNFLIKFIKPYDGTREKLNSFLTNCNDAYDLASNHQKPILFRYIKSQLEGKAETACSIKEFECWEQLAEFLKTQFGEKKHYTHLLTDLQECRQFHNEQISQYALRVETCLSKLLTELTLSNVRKTELPGKTAAMEDLALHTFLLGMSTNISNLVRAKDPHNLNTAINLATSEEKIQNMLHKRNNPIRNTYNHQPPRPQRGHEYQPRTNNTHNHITNTRTPTGHNQHANNLTCRYCKFEGHTIENCRKREYNNRFKTRNSSTPPHANKHPQYQNSYVPQPRVYCIEDTPDEYNQPQIELYQQSENNLNAHGSLGGVTRDQRPN